MDNDNTTVLASIISAIGGIIIAYIVNIASKKREKTKRATKPVDRWEQMFDGYDRLIDQKDKEDERKAHLIAQLEAELASTKEVVRNLEQALDISRREQEESRKENQQLKDMLQTMRDEYNESKQRNQNNGL